MEGGYETRKEKKDTFTYGKGKVETFTSRSCDIKCYHSLGFDHIASQCPYKRVMVTRDNDEMESEDEDNIKVEVPPLAVAGDECIEYTIKGNVFVVK